MSMFHSVSRRSTWTIRTIVAAAAALTLTATSVVPANATDAEGPQILHASVSPETVDVIDGPTQVKVRLEVEDTESGVAAEGPWIDTYPVSGGRDPIPGQAMTLVSGDQFRGVYEATFTFPEMIRSGDWVFQANIQDQAGNHYSSTNDIYASIGVNATVLSNPDTTGPSVWTYASTQVVDITDGPAEVVVTAEAYDEGIGIPADTEIGVYARKGNSGTGWSVKNSSNDPHRAKFEATSTYGAYDPSYDTRGTYSYSFTGIVDANGNENSSSYLPAGEVIVATKPLRAKRPDLHTAVNAVKASWLPHDDLLGILEYETEFTGPNLVQTVKSVATEATLTGAAEGIYTARVRARNQLGWGQWTTASVPAEHTFAPMDSSIPTVSGTPKVGQTLTAGSGTWTSDATLAYRWFADDVAVSGGTESTLILTPTFVGKTVAVRVTGSKPGYQTTSRTSLSTAAVTHEVSVAPVVFTDKDGIAEDTYTVPVVEGVDYLIGTDIIPAGTYPGTGTVTVTAKAQPDYVLTGDVTEWAHTFEVTPHEVSVAPVVFTDKDGIAEDTYTVPVVEGVDYLIGTDIIPAGTYPGTGTVTVTAKAQPDYVLTGDVTEWAHTYATTPASTTPEPEPGARGVRLDFDGDGHADVIGRDSAGRLWLYPGNGTGGWKRPQQIGSGWQGFTSIFSPGDFDGDTHADVIGRDSAGRLWLYPGNGTGGWKRPQQIGSGWQGFTSIFSPGDFDGDTHADVIGRDSAGRLWLYPGNGTGGWKRPQQIGSGWQGFTSIIG